MAEEKKIVIVTGGAGFIGAHLCEKLLESSRVICIDSFLTSDVANIDALLRNPDFVFLKHDINEPIDLTKFPDLDRFRVDVKGVQEIYHLACPTSAKNFDHLRIQTLLTNSLAMRNVLELAVSQRARILHASTAVVYGPRKKDDQRFVESDIGIIDQASPRACYDEGKRFAETACFTYSSVHGLDVRIARVFRTYGPKQRLGDGEMIPDFVLDALEGRDLIVYGDKDFKTSLLYVTDLVDGLIRLMNVPENPGPVNFGADKQVRLHEVAQMIIDMTGSSSKVAHEPPLLFMTKQGIADTRKAVDALGWIPLVRLEDGLKKTIEYTQVTQGLARNI